MTAVTKVVRAEWRDERRSLLALALVAALVAGFALAAANGARRVETSWARLKAATSYPHAAVNVPFSGLDAALAAIATDDRIASFGALSWMPAAPAELGLGATEVGLFAGIGPGFGTDLFESLIDEGRAARPGRADEITINRPYAELTGLDVGDQVRLTGPGIDQPATVVGIHRSSLEIGPNGGLPGALGTIAFTERWLPVVSEIDGFDELRMLVALRFEDDVDAEEVLRSLLERIPDASAIPGEALDGDVRDGLVAGTNAYRVLTGASALSGCILLVFAAGRRVRNGADRVAPLRGMGMARRDRAIALAAAPAFALVIGTVVGAAGSTIGSRLVRTGFARTADPETGIWVDLPVLVGGAAVLALVTTAGIGTIGWRTARGAPGTGRPVTANPSRLARISAPAALGIGAALGELRPGTRRAATATTGVLVLALTGLIASLSWEATLDRLEDDPALQGWSFDAAAMSAPGVTAAETLDLGRRLAASAGVDAASLVSGGTIPFRGSDVDLYGIRSLAGRIDPRIVAGRMATAETEVVVGRHLRRTQHLDIGSSIQLDINGEQFTGTVVGEVVFPFLGNTAFGDTLLVTDEGLNRLGFEPSNFGVLLDLAPGTSLDPVRAIANDRFSVERPRSAPPVLRMSDAAGVTRALLAFLAAASACALAVSVMAAGRRHRRDLAVARAIGFGRRQVVATFAWQVAVTVTVAVVIAAPTGLAIGRRLWDLTTRSLGIVDAYRLPVGPLTGFALITAAIAVIIATASAIRPSRARLAPILRSE